MTVHPTEERLNEFADDLLPDEKGREVAGHLASCPECRLVVTSIRSLRERAASLPEIAPARDLWPDIARRIGRRKAGPVRFRILPGFHIPRPLAMAAGVALVIVASSAVTIFVMERDGTGTGTEMTGLTGGRVALAAFESAETDYAEATRQLLTAYEARRDRLSPETVKVVEENLRIIDDALRKSREALEKDPSNRGLSDLTAATYQRKIDFLRRTLSLSS